MSKKFSPVIKFFIPFAIGLIFGLLILQHFLLKEFEVKPAVYSAFHFKKEVKETKNLFSKDYNQKRIEVDLNQQKMILFGDNKKLLVVEISSGKKENPTPKGSFRVIQKSPMIYSKTANCWLPFWVGFTEDGHYGFHELPICNGKRVGGEEIGKPASLGCIRLRIGEAEDFYNFVGIGTKVEIYGQTP